MKYEIRTNKVENGTNGVVAMATIVIEDKFVLNNIRLVYKPDKEQYSVRYPARKSERSDTGYKTVFHPNNSELSQALKEAILTSYNTGEPQVVKNDTEFNLSVNVSPTNISKNSLVGYCKVKFSEKNEFVVNDIAIKKDSEGKRFVSMPSFYKRKDEKFVEICNPITSEFREELHNSLLDSYYMAKNDIIYLFQINASHNREGNYFDGEDPYRVVDVSFYMMDEYKTCQCVKKIHDTSEYCYGGDSLLEPEASLPEIKDFYKNFSANNPDKEIVVIKIRRPYATVNYDLLNLYLERYHKDKKSVYYERLSHDKEKKPHKKSR